MINIQVRFHMDILMSLK